MRIAIVGAGGVGGYFGARLAESGADVTFIARGAHLDAMRSRGLHVRSPKGDLHLPRVNATADPHESYVSAVIETPGVIKHTAMDHLIFGELDGAHSPRLQLLFDACRRASFQSTLSDHITVDIWTKFVRLSVFSGMTAVTRSPIGVIMKDPDLLEMLKAAVGEALAVARASGVPVAETIVEDVAGAYAALPPQAKASMLEDLERGRRIELPWLSGAVVRIGRETGVATPIHAFITTVLKPHLNGTLG